MDFELSDWDIRYQIELAEKAFNLDKRMIACIILQESGANPWVTRYEAPFYSRYVKGKTRGTLIGHVPKNISLITEMTDRATSWGLMQCMGQTARELGYDSDSFLLLAIPQVGILYGCKKLQRCFNTSNGDWLKAFSKYNGGGNPLYPKEVMERFTKSEYLKIIGR